MAPKSNNGREVRAVLWLLPMLAVVSWLVWESRNADSGFGYAKNEEDTVQAVSRQRGADTASTDRGQDGGLVADFKTVTSSPPPSPRLFAFDPNTVTYHDLLRLGFERGEALGIIKYRERGKVFEIPEDFAACFQVSEAMYRRLEPYIRIGEKYRLKPFARSTPVSPRNNTPVSRQSGADAALIAVPGKEDSTERTASTEEQGSVTGAPLSRENRPILLDLNTADSAALISVVGIGERTVVSIMEYRRRLGGFARVEQLAEIRGVTEQNYERIIEQIYIDPAVIQKIDINFAPAKTLASHPYMRAEALRKLLKQRQLKGGWRTPEELEKDDIFTAEELTKLSPYLIFN